MKITVGLGSIDNYIPFLKAGADAFFCGYIPYSWSEKHGLLTPLNRREVMYCNVQIGSESEMIILHKMMDRFHAPVSITLNSLYYTPEEYPELAEYMLHCKELGFTSFIIADPGLLLYLHRHSLASSFDLHLSGEFGEFNHLLADSALAGDISRVILHRKIFPQEMTSIISYFKEKGLSTEFEAFAMNEMCHFHGGFCNSLHCDELSHMCLVPYRIGPVRKKVLQPPTGNSRESSLPNLLFNDNNREEENSLPDDLPGSSGCGLCALWQLRQAGVEWLKLVSRGAYDEETLVNIRALKKALLILERSSSEKAYQFEMKQNLFPLGCSRNCYYPVENC